LLVVPWTLRNHVLLLTSLRNSRSPQLIAFQRALRLFSHHNLWGIQVRGAGLVEKCMEVGRTVKINAASVRGLCIIHLGV